MTRRIGSGLGRVLAAAALLTAAGTGAARPLEAVTFAGEKIRVDGLLREWPATLDALGTAVQGAPAGGGPQASAAVGYDATTLYVGATIRDARLARTSGFGEREDHLAVELVFPLPEGTRARVLRFFAGEIGKSPGRVTLDGATVKGARLVEAPAAGGYTLEASLPWSALPEAARLRAGLRAAIRYVDADSPGQVRAVVATAPGSGGKLPPLLLEAEQGLHRDLLRARGLPETASRVAVGDFVGDAALEVASVHGGNLVILGHGYRGGKEFYFRDLGVPDGASVTRLEARDLTGDGKAELVIGRRRGSKERHRDTFEIHRMQNGDTPYLAFAHETAIVTPEGRVENEVSLAAKGGVTEITVAQGAAEGFDPATYAEPVPGDMPSALLPWQTVKSRRFAWNGKQFAEVGMESWTPKVSAPAPRAVAADDGPPPPPPPRPPTSEELLDRVYALYRQDRGVGAAAPRFDFVTDVAGDRAPERVLIHGKDVVVFGKGFKAGTSYAFITIGVEGPKDVVDATARDLTGDGKAEIVVRGLLHAKASKEMGGQVVDRHALYVYQVTGEGIRRIFAAETGRALGSDSLLASVRFLPAGRATAIELGPGRAVGWSEKTYPFPVDRAPYGGLEPLVVPWAEGPARRYLFDGTAYQPSP